MAAGSALPRRSPGDLLQGFLAFRPNLDYCDACLAKAVGLGLEETRATMRDVSRHDAYLRDSWKCGACGKNGLVTRALSNRLLRDRPLRLAARAARVVPLGLVNRGETEGR